LLMMLLRFVLNEPISKPWGYQERVMNLYEAHLAVVSSAYQGMNQMVMCQLPLPYVQLCKVLLLVFILSYPLSIDLNHGIWGNVVVPVILAVTLMGFENVADFLENPLGDDSADISVYECIHEFEVEVQSLFNASQVYRQSIVASWSELGHNLGVPLGCGLLSQPTHSTPRPGFNSFFEWSVLPADVISYVIDQTSDAGRVNMRALMRALRCGRSRDHSERSSERSRDANEDEERETLMDSMEDSEIEANHFAISRCIALRGTLPHLLDAKRQLRAVERVGEFGGPASFWDAVHGSGG